MTDKNARSWRGAPWETGLGFLAQYVDATGSADIRVDHETLEGFRLGRWVNTQRVWRRSGRLTQDRIDRLDALGFVWEPMSQAQRQREQRDTDMLVWLAAFVATNGHSDAPSELTLSDGTNAGAWVRLVRREFVTGKIRPELEASLRQLRFEFTPNQAKFARGLAALQHYVAAHESLHVPSTHVTDDGFNLGAWFASAKMKLRRGGLRDEDANALRGLGIDGTHDPREETWNQHLDTFRAWVAAHGHPGVPKELQTDDGTRLGQWLGVQRNWLVQGRLKEDRKRLLDSVHSDWAATRSARWDRDSAIEAIAEAATMAFPLTVSAYLDLRASGLDIPPLSRIQRLFGSWMDACVAAGVQSGPSTVSWQTEKHSDIEVLRLLRNYLEAAGDTAGLDSYDNWAKEFDAPPRSVLLRRFTTWDGAIGKALSLADEVVDRD